MTTYLLHVTISEVIQKALAILIAKNYEISYENLEKTMIVGYKTTDSLKMVQVNLSIINSYLELNVHSTCFSAGTSLLTNDFEEEEELTNQIEESFTTTLNNFRLTPEDYVFSLM